MSDLSAQLKALDGKVVVLKSARFNGYYVDAHHSMVAHVTGCPQSELVPTEWCKFIVHHIEGNVVCFESLRYRDHYLDLNHEKYKQDYHKVKITESNDVPSQLSWARFSVVGDDLSKVGIRSERWTNRWLDAHTSEFLLGTMHDPNHAPTESWGVFSIMFSSPIKDYYKLVAAHTNKGTKEVPFEFKYSIGMSHTDSNTNVNSIKVSFEAEKNFGCAKFTSGSIKFGTEYSHQWEASESETYTASTETAVTIAVPPGKTVEIYQLQAEYGPLQVGSNFTRNEEHD